MVRESLTDFDYTCGRRCERGILARRKLERPLGNRVPEYGAKDRPAECTSVSATDQIGPQLTRP